MFGLRLKLIIYRTVLNIRISTCQRQVTFYHILIQMLPTPILAANVFIWTNDINLWFHTRYYKCRNKNGPYINRKLAQWFYMFRKLTESNNWWVKILCMLTTLSSYHGFLPIVKQYISELKGHCIEDLQFSTPLPVVTRELVLAAG